MPLITVFAVLGEDHTAGRSINGWPMFTQCRVWLIDDYHRAIELAKEIVREVEARPIPRRRRRTVAHPV